MKRIRVLVGRSVYENATAFIQGDVLWVEFDADDLDSLCFQVDEQRDITEMLALFKGVQPRSSSRDN